MKIESLDNLFVRFKNCQNKIIWDVAARMESELGKLSALQNFQFLFYVTAYNMYDTLVDILERDQLPEEALGFLLAGAYYGGHHHLIELVDEKIESQKSKQDPMPTYVEDDDDFFQYRAPQRYKHQISVNNIRYMGYLAAMWAGRYSLIKDFEIISRLNEYSDARMGEIRKYHFHVTKANVKAALTPPFRNLLSKDMISSISETVLESYKGDVVRWFLISGLGKDINLGSLSYIGYEKLETILKYPQAMASLDKFSRKTLARYPTAEKAYRYYEQIRINRNQLERESFTFPRYAQHVAIERISGRD